MDITHVLFAKQDVNTVEKPIYPSSVEIQIRGIVVFTCGRR
jgi:hypothetical protein